MLKYLMLSLIFLFSGSTIQAASQSKVVLTNDTQRFDLALNLAILEDPLRAHNIEQIISPLYVSQFYPNAQSVPNFGRSQSAFWVRFTLNNQSELKWYARINALLGHDVSIYVLDDDGKIITNDIVNLLPNQGIYTWSLALPKEKNVTFYIRATNGGAIFGFPIELLSADRFVEQTRIDLTLNISIIAALIMMAIYNLLSFIVLRESSYLVLSIHIISVAMILQIIYPIYNVLEFLRDTGSHFFTTPIYIAVISFLVFCRQLLQTNVFVPKLDYLIIGLTFICCGLIFITAWIPDGKFLPQLMFIFAFALVMVASLIRSLQGNHTAKYFLLVFLIITFMVIPNAITNVFAETKWLSSNFYSAGLSTLLFLLLLSLIQSEKTRRWREQNQKVVASKEATDEFLMTISHELRTPIQSLIGTGELLKSTPLNPAQEDYLQKQEYASKHLLGLVNDILTLGAISKGNHTKGLANDTFEINAILEELNQLFCVPADKKGLILTISPVSSLCPPLIGDVKHLRQVLSNLLNNAIKYTEQGSVQLCIGLKKDPALPLMNVHFSVKDTGIGIPVTQQEELFKPFYQINQLGRKRSGFGLGLAISHQLVKRMGGELQLRNRHQSGSCFFFDLNFSIDTKGESIESGKDRLSTNQMPLSGIRILLVDDDELNQLIAQKLLKSQGAEVLLAGNSQETLSQIRKLPFDLVLMDLDLPDLDGYETTRIIRADKQILSCPIVALTAFGLGNEREKCLDAGMDDYLSKPYAIETLVSVILKHLRSHS